MSTEETTGGRHVSGDGLLYYMALHCAVFVGSGTTFLAGGLNGGQDMDRAFLYNKTQGEKDDDHQDPRDLIGFPLFQRFLCPTGPHV